MTTEKEKTDMATYAVKAEAQMKALEAEKNELEQKLAELKTEPKK